MVTYRENIGLRQLRITRLRACSNPTKITTTTTTTAIKLAPPATSHKIALKSNLNNKILNSETTAACTLSTIATTTAENNCKKFKSRTKYCIMLTHKGSCMLTSPVKISSSTSVVGAAFIAPTTTTTSKAAVRTASTISPNYKTLLRSMMIIKSPSAITSLQCRRSSRTADTTTTTSGGVCIVGIRNNFTSNMADGTVFTHHLTVP
uniref:Uncharacterized protein n=1 Tax=Glossina austeni TaxID=7395 RepID=A0A1A9VTZ1_GLOAU